MEARIEQADCLEHRYSVGTWDTDTQAYTPQHGLGKSLNITWRELVKAIRGLRRMGYTAHRIRGSAGGDCDNDTGVLVQRTDGMTDAEVIESWKR